MKDNTLRDTFLTTCTTHRIFTPIDQVVCNKKSDLINRAEIINKIPFICLAIGIPLTPQDRELTLLTTKHGTLNEFALFEMSRPTRLALIVAMILAAIRYRRSNTLIDIKTVTWIREQVTLIKLTNDQKCPYHGAFIDWYKVVNEHLFSRVVVPEQIKG